MLYLGDISGLLSIYLKCDNYNDFFREVLCCYIKKYMIIEEYLSIFKETHGYLPILSVSTLNV